MIMSKSSSQQRIASAVWTYQFASSDAQATSLALHGRRTSECLYCGTRMETIPAQPLANAHWPAHFDERTVIACPVCGWWMRRDTHHGTDAAGAYAFSIVNGAIGSLYEFHQLDSTLPLGEIRSYLAARYESRKQLSPKALEEVVASVYRDIGYADVVVTGQTNDGGVDVAMTGSDGKMVAVQVKRYENKIEAEQIRAFTGALLIRGITKGLFVTTSVFTKGARSAAALSGSRGYPVELIDATRFYEALKIAQRECYSNAYDSLAPYSSCSIRIASLATS